ncbi:MAG: LysR family transcriptional regulator [Gordonia sp. (in: high G+C Gram-positive bacteria)]|nr:MAG: LysR family transcriptional regulator [Gordonia sp. (in: high G+C Gram-positive bacteria)]
MTVKYTLHQLEYLVAIADAGSISAAAAAAHASAGGVSLAIGELESRLGTALFIRRKAKAVTLTAAGTRVLADARRILAAAEELQASAGATQNDITGTLAVGCYSTLAPFVIPPMLDDFGGQHGSLDVQVLEGSADEIVGALTDGRCEIGFLYGNDLRDGLDSAVIRTTKPYVILAADHRLASHPAVRLADLADEPLIMFDVPSARNAAQMLASLGLTARIRHFSSNIEVVRGLVARGIGYSILIQRWPINVSYEGRPVVAKPIIDVTIERKMVLAWPAGLRQTRRALALIEFCRNEFLDDPVDLTF